MRNAKQWCFVLERQRGLEKLSNDDEIAYAIYTKKEPTEGVICFKERKSGPQTSQSLWKATKCHNTDCTILPVRKLQIEIENCKKDGPDSYYEIKELKQKQWNQARYWHFTLEKQTGIGLEKLSKDDDIEYAIYSKKKEPVEGVICFKERKSRAQATRTIWKATRFTAYSDCKVRQAGNIEVENCKKDGPDFYNEIKETPPKNEETTMSKMMKFKETVNGGITSPTQLRKQHPYLYQKYPQFVRDHLMKTLGRKKYYETLAPEHLRQTAAVTEDPAIHFQNQVTHASGPEYTPPGKH